MRREPEPRQQVILIWMAPTLTGGSEAQSFAAVSRQAVMFVTELCDLQRALAQLQKINVLTTDSNHLQCVSIR